MLALPLLALPQLPLHAQVGSAPGQLTSKASETNLPTQLRRTDMKAEAAQILAVGVRNCNRVGKLYNPGTPASDSSGCIPVVDQALTAVVNKIIDCNKKLQIYNGYKCISLPTGSAPTLAP